MNYTGETKAVLGGAINQASPRSLTDIDVAHETLSFAMSVASRCCALADALTGPVPTDSAGKSVQGNAGAILPMLGVSAHETRGRLGDAMDALSRIERATGLQ